MNPDEKFVHLHVHTEYSLLDGLSQINRLIDRADELEMPSLAITDHGTMFGVVDFFRAAKGKGIKPIIGVEAYLAPRGMEDRDPKLDKKAFHMLLLAKNQTGYQNLLKLSSEAQLRGYYYNPRIDRELLAQHSEGIVATSGCLGAQVPQSIMAGNDDQARELIGWYQEVFGPENFFLELQYHDIDVLENVNRWLAEYRSSGHTPVQFLATNDVHYVLKSDHDPHDTLLCIQTGNLKTDGNRLRMSDATYHLTSHEEMAAILEQKYPWLPEEMRFEALYNTAKVAAMCDTDLETEGYHLPRFPVPQGFTEREYLRYLVEKGRRWRYGDDADLPVYQTRMEHELNIIDSMGFNTYFLIVWDLCEFARHADIWWNVRGSGAGSLVAYCLGITNIDPIQNSLIFERFLNPSRQTMPDIDLDYPDDRRGEMIEYTAQKYGSDKVAAIITFGTMGAKAAIRDVGRALDVPLSDVNTAVSYIPTEARQKKIDEYVESSPELRQLYRDNPRLREVIDTAKVLQGVARHASTHAAGIIVADKPLVEYLPLHRLTRGEDENSTLQQVTQFPMETCESLGLLKVDFLGLSTLTIMRRASDLIYKHHGKRWTMDNIPYRPHEGDTLSDEQQRENQMLAEAFVMMGEGHTIGVFQVESPGMQQMLRGMRPKKFEHIIAGISLYRPGPMAYIDTYNARMQGKEAVTYHHEKLEPILAETYGIMVYQEQILQIAGQLFSYPLSEADLMRRAVSKKKQKELVKHKQLFMERGPENGISPDVAEKIFDDIEYFANYGFNKCVVGDTQIVDAETGQTHTVRDLYEGRVSIVQTLSLDTENGHIVPRRIQHVMHNGVKPVYTLTTAAGRTITATDNHPFYTPDGWVNLGELVTGQCVAVAGGRGRPRPYTQPGSSPLSLYGGGDLGVGEIAAPPLTTTWDEIVTIEYAGEQPTYDLTIEGTHNFVANDIIVHNSHAADYAVITVQTAFLKAHYPAEYMAALLSVYREDTTKVSTFLEECGRLQIPILPPDVNHSHNDFDIQVLDDGTRGVRFGMAAIKNAGVAAVQTIIDAREEGGPFASLTDFCQRVDLRLVGKRTLESLVKVGALDQFADHRAQLLNALDQMVNYSADHHHAKDIGQMSMFGGAAGTEDDIQLTDVEPFKPRDMLNWEKELLGFYVTDHPIDEVLRKFYMPNIMQSFQLKSLDEFGNKDKGVAMVGLVAGVRDLTTRNGDAMAVISLEDRYGTTEVVMFPRTWEGNKHVVRENINKPVLLKGKIDFRRGDVQVIADRVTTEFEVYDRADYASQPPPSYEPPPMPEPVRYDTNGDVDDSAPPPWETPPPDAAAPPPPTPRTPTPAPDAALNGDAARIAQDLAQERHMLDPDTPHPDETIWCVEVTFVPSGDDDKDFRRLRRIHGHLIEHPGQDLFAIVIARPGQRPQLLEFEHQRTHACDELFTTLSEIVGEENVRIFEKP